MRTETCGQVRKRRGPGERSTEPLRRGVTRVTEDEGLE